ncbi:MAG: hypothetical protein Q9210_007107 [Variospora velana]
MAMAWKQTPEYIQTSNWAQTPGDPTNYVVDRPVGPSPLDVTSFHPGQATWSPTNLPDVSATLVNIGDRVDHSQILYVLKPPPVWNRYRSAQLPGPKIDQHGRVIYEKWPKDPKKPEPLLDFPHLPDQIGSQEWWFIFEAWRRFEPRARWKDFTMRIHGPSRPSSHNIIQMHISRNRPKWGLLCWFAIALHDEKNGARDEALKMLSDEQINNNTTRGTTPGLIDPSLGEAGGRVSLPIMEMGAGGRLHCKAPRKGSRRSARKKHQADVLMNALDNSTLPTSIHELTTGALEEQHLAGHGLVTDFYSMSEFSNNIGTNQSIKNNSLALAVNPRQRRTGAAAGSFLLSKSLLPCKGKKRKVEAAFGSAYDLEAWRAQQTAHAETPLSASGIGHSYRHEAWPHSIYPATIRPESSTYATQTWYIPSGFSRRPTDHSEPDIELSHYDSPHSGQGTSFIHTKAFEYASVNAPVQFNYSPSLHLRSANSDQASISMPTQSYHANIHETSRLGYDQSHPEEDLHYDAFDLPLWCE